MTSGTWEACCSPSESWEPRMPDPELDVLHNSRATQCRASADACAVFVCLCKEPKTHLQ